MDPAGRLTREPARNGSGIRQVKRELSRGRGPIQETDNSARSRAGEGQPRRGRAPARNPSKLSSTPVSKSELAGAIEGCPYVLKIKSAPDVVVFLRPSRVND